LARAEIEDRRVRAAEQPLQLLAALAGSDIERGAPLVAIPHLVAGRASHEVAARRLQLQHLGPEVGHQHRRHRPGATLRAVENLQPLTRGPPTAVGPLPAPPAPPHRRRRAWRPTSRLRYPARRAWARRAGSAAAGSIWLMFARTRGCASWRDP